MSGKNRFLERKQTKNLMRLTSLNQSNWYLNSGFFRLLSSFVNLTQNSSVTFLAYVKIFFKKMGRRFLAGILPNLALVSTIKTDRRFLLLSLLQGRSRRAYMDYLKQRNIGGILVFLDTFIRPRS